MLATAKQSQTQASRASVSSSNIASNEWHSPKLGKWLSQQLTPGKQITKIWLMVPQLDGQKEALGQRLDGAS